MRPPVWLSLLTLGLLVVAWLTASHVVQSMPIASGAFCCEYPAGYLTVLIPLSFWVPLVGYAIVHLLLRPYPRLYWLETLGAFAVVGFYYLVAPMWDSGTRDEYPWKDWTTYSGYPLVEGAMQIMLIGALVTVTPLLVWLIVNVGRREGTA